MKRAKIILTIIALFAVIGGVLAYNASRIRIILYSNNGQKICEVTILIAYSTVPQFPGQPAATITNLYNTTTSAGPCPTRTWYIIE